MPFKRERQKEYSIDITGGNTKKTKYQARVYEGPAAAAAAAAVATAACAVDFLRLYSFPRPPLLLSSTPSTHPPPPSTLLHEPQRRTAPHRARRRREMGGPGLYTGIGKKAKGTSPRSSSPPAVSPRFLNIFSELPFLLRCVRLTRSLGGCRSAVQGLPDRPEVHPHHLRRQWRRKFPAMPRPLVTPFYQVVVWSVVRGRGVV
jgi:hypothetical protein